MNRAVCVIGLALLPGVTIAVPNEEAGAPGYTYLQGDYLVDGDAGGLERDYNGYAAEASLAITNHVYANARYDLLDVDGSRVDADRASVGVGLNDFVGYGKAEGTGIGYYAQVSYERLALDGLRLSDGEAQGNGYGVDAGLRWAIHSRIEINPHVGWVDYGDIDDDIDLGSADGLRYGVRILGYLTDHFALTAGYRGSDVETEHGNIGFDDEYRVGARLSF